VTGGGTSNLVSLGVIVKAHGLRGEARVKPWNEDSKLLGTLTRVTLIGKDKSERPASIKARKVAEGWLVTIEGVADKDAADALRGTELAVARELLPPIDPEEVYLVDLVGLEVYDGDRRVGVVDAIFEYPSVDCLQVTGEDGVRELPMLEAYVVNVDRERKRIEATRTDELPVEPKRTKPAR
jgi:16S rRNA processing protein RimM